MSEQPPRFDGGIEVGGTTHRKPEPISLRDVRARAPVEPHPKSGPIFKPFVKLSPAERDALVEAVEAACEVDEWLGRPTGQPRYDALLRLRRALARFSFDTEASS